MDVSKRIYELRTARNWAGERLAKEAGISQSTISNIEKNIKSPTIYTLEKICTALDISLHDFFSIASKKNSNDDERTCLLNALIVECKYLTSDQIISLTDFIRKIRPLD